MACTDCLNNCAGGPLSDKCVQYTGDDIDSLGICNGDSLYEIEAIILEQLQTAISGTGISLTDNTVDCQFLLDILAGKSPTLANIIQMLIDGECTLNTLITNLQTQVDGTYTFNTSCLTLGTNPTKDDILQATINKLCSLSTSVTNISNDYVKTSDLCTLVQSCGSSTSSSTQEYSKMPKYVALPYHGPLSVFDSNGKGISSAGYDKVYMCIGQTVNGFTLPDYRGRSPLGANSNIPTSGIDSDVNPALAANAGYAVVNNQKKGNYTNTLTSTQIPSHTHTITDPGHKHFLANRGALNDGTGPYSGNGGSGLYFNNTTNLAYTGITINSSGGGQAHNSLHPVVGSVFIMYVP